MTHNHEFRAAATVLDKILARKHDEVAERQKRIPIEELRAHARDASPVRGFADAIRGRLRESQPAVIAEIKKASPSKGLIRADFEPQRIARWYEEAGASCLSVLTDRNFFQGDSEHLIAAREASALPVLRKDFIVSSYQVVESRALGADCILLIVAAIEADGVLADLAAAAVELGMDVLVEVHNAQELRRALTLETPLIGVNNRNLHTFETRLTNSINLKDQFPANRILIAESGIHSAEDVAMLRQNGINAFLVGESLMRAADPGAKLRELFFKSS